MHSACLERKKNDISQSARFCSPWPFKTLAKKLFGEQLYQHARATFLHNQRGLGLDWKWGNSLRSVRPIRRDFGWREGQPIDRYYTEQQFLSRYKGDIHGRVLEIGDNRYTRQFGGENVTESDLLGYPGNSGTTIQADLTKADHIPSAIFDCAILTFTLQFIFDVRAAIRTLERILKPGEWHSSLCPASLNCLDTIWTPGASTGDSPPCR